MKKACGAAPQTQSSFSAVKPNNWRQEAEGRMKVSGEKEKKGKRGLFLQRRSSLPPWFRFRVQNGPKGLRNISCNIHQRRGITYVYMAQRKQEGKKICIANDVLEMDKVEDLQQHKDEKWESRSDCVLPSLLLYIKLPGEDSTCYHNMSDLLMCPVKTPVVGTDTSSQIKMQPADWDHTSLNWWLWCLLQSIHHINICKAVHDYSLKAK